MVNRKRVHHLWRTAKLQVPKPRRWRRRGVNLAFSRPETPTGNPFIEAFNGRVR
jgi:putative transposase